MTTSKARENSVRRWAGRLGLVLRKSRARRIHLDNLGGYMVVDRGHNAVVSGSRYELSLDDVEEVLMDYEGRLVAE